MTPLRLRLPLFQMKPRPIPEVVNFAQTSESPQIKKVAALKDSHEDTIVYEDEGEI